MTRADFATESLYRQYVEFYVRLVLLRISTEAWTHP